MPALSFVQGPRRRSASDLSPAQRVTRVLQVTEMNWKVPQDRKRRRDTRSSSSSSLSTQNVLEHAH